MWWEETGEVYLGQTTSPWADPFEAGQPSLDLPDGEGLYWLAAAGADQGVVPFAAPDRLGPVDPLAPGGSTRTPRTQGFR